MKPSRVKHSTLIHIQSRLLRHQIHVDATIESVGQYLYESSAYLTRIKQSELCNVSVCLIYRILHLYAEALPQQPLRGKRYTLHPYGEKTLTEWVIWAGTPRLTLCCVSMRLYHGWGLEDALTRHVRRHSRKKNPQ